MLLWAAPPGPVAAHQRAEHECLEAGAFIMNAAISRDAGLPEETYMARLAEDLEAIRAFPPELRWFVQDKDDEVMLLDAVKEVFRAPRSPKQHRRCFLDRCLRGQVGCDGDTIRDSSPIETEELFR
jgi:hypothetical protein